MEAEPHNLRVALLGCGQMGLHHLRVIATLPNAKLVGIADPRAKDELIRDVAGSSVTIAASAEALLDQVRPDIVHVVTPPETHYLLGRLAIEYGTHLYVEKPFTLERRHAEELVSAAQRKGLKICAGHQLLAHEATRRAEKALPDIGKLVHVESFFSFRKVRRSLSDADQLLDILPHPVYTLLHFLKLGSPHDNISLLSTVARTPGEVRAIVGCTSLEALLVVSLRGRPVESYLKLVGTNGSIHVDYVRGTVVFLTGSGFDAIAAITNPYRQGAQILWKTTAALLKTAWNRHTGYPGLRELVAEFYRSILAATKPPVNGTAIVETVGLCERIAAEVKSREQKQESAAATRLLEQAPRLPDTVPRGMVLVTGGTGYLGKILVERLRSAGWPVRVISRRATSYSDRVAGVEYVFADLGDPVPPDLVAGAAVVIHCAAETSGGRSDHERNSVIATRNILLAAAKAGIRSFVHISSLAVLQPSHRAGTLLNESSPIDSDPIRRGPYVWGKAKAEEVVRTEGPRLGIDVKVIRPGPLVDFQKFEPPGRLGREIGSIFVVMGSRKSTISVCDVRTVAQVVMRYLNDIHRAPPILNLVEPCVPTREELVARLCKNRGDLHPIYVPFPIVRAASAMVRAVQRIAAPSRKPLDIASAFASEAYDTMLAREILGEVC